MSSWKRKRMEAMGDEDLCDVHLVGTDGVEVPCSKSTLAMCSPVFKSMFFKGFREQTVNQCNLDYHSVALRLIVKYCYFGEVDIDLIFRDNRSLEEEVSILLDLRKAGAYFEIEDLSIAAEAKIGNLVFQSNDDDNKKYLYAPAFLTELLKREELQDLLGRAIFCFAVDNTMSCFGPRAPGVDSVGIHHPDPIVMLGVVQSSNDTFTVVRCLQSWFAVERSKSAENSCNHDEKGRLVAFAENIDLKKLNTSELSEIKPCCLFSSERILEAFVHRCKSRDVVNEVPRTKLFKLYVSGEDIMESVDGYYMHAGKYKGLTLNIFHKNIEHNGIPCKSLIHRRPGENKWLISIAKHDWKLRTHRDGGWNISAVGVDEKSIQMHVYESSDQSLPTEDPMEPPLNGWKCFEGADPALLLVCMYRKSNKDGGAVPNRPSATKSNRRLTRHDDDRAPYCYSVI